MKEKFFSHVTPFLPVYDLKDTLMFYKKQLGFTDEWIWEQTAPVGGISRNNLKLLFQQHPVYTKMINTENESFELIIYVENIEAIFKEYKEKEVKFISGMVSHPWGVSEFVITDPNGYWLRISEGSN